jgi:hypothetical protein
MATKVQLTGGAFQDPEGNLLANGFLLMELNQDAQVNTSTEVCAGFVLKILLDANGNVAASPAQYVWPNDVLSPGNTFYTVTAYTAQGQLVWGPNTQLVLSSPSPFDIGKWVPGSATQAVSVTTYDIGVFLPGQPSASQLMLYLPLERTVSFTTNLTPSVASANTPAAADSVFTLKKNGVQFGTLTFHANGTSTFTAASTTIFSAGDVLSIVAPATPDTALANIGVVLSGNTIQ